MSLFRMHSNLVTLVTNIKLELTNLYREYTSEFSLSYLKDTRFARPLFEQKCESEVKVVYSMLRAV